MSYRTEDRRWRSAAGPAYRPDAFQTVRRTIERALHDGSRRWLDGPLGWLEARVDADRFQLLIALLLAVTCGLLLRHGPALACHAVAFAFPLLATVEQLKPLRRPWWWSDERVELTAYWTTYAAVHLVQRHLPSVVALIPLYHPAITAFLAWCFWSHGAMDVLYKIGRYLKGCYRISYD